MSSGGGPSKSPSAPADKRGKPVASPAHPSRPPPTFIVGFKSMRALYTNAAPNQSSQSWTPPLFARDLEGGTSTHLLWSDGTLGAIDVSQLGHLERYGVASIFVDKRTLPLWVVNIDATQNDVAADATNGRWRYLNFIHRRTSNDSSWYYSYATFASEFLETATKMPARITPQLVPNQHDSSNRTRGNAGLIGELSLLLGLAALSGPEQYLRDILTRAVRSRRWQGHNYGEGHEARRGVVVTIYYDPRNSGSTEDALDRIREGRSGGAFYNPNP